MPPQTMLVRSQWSQFERWLEPRRNAIKHRRDEITKEYDAKWLTTPAKSRAKKESHDTQKASLIRELEEKHFGEAREQWQQRLIKARLRDDDWGPMTEQELLAVSRALGGDLDEEVEKPNFARNVFVAPQPQVNGPVLAPPILSSASRSSNFSASSYALVSPADLGSDDELYTAVSSYVVVSHFFKGRCTWLTIPPSQLAHRRIRR